MNLDEELESLKPGGQRKLKFENKAHDSKPVDNSPLLVEGKSINTSQTNLILKVNMIKLLVL